MMIRLAALAFNAYKLQSECNGDGVLAFGAGLSDVEDPDGSLADFTGRGVEAIGLGAGTLRRPAGAGARPGRGAREPRGTPRPPDRGGSPPYSGPPSHGCRCAARCTRI